MPPSASRRALLTAALATVGLPVEVPATRGIGLVVQIVELHEGGGRVEVRGYEAVSAQVWSGGRREALDRVAGVLEALGYPTRRAVLGSVCFTIPTEVAAEEAEAEAGEEEWTGDCVVEGGLGAVECWAAARAVSA